MSPATGAHDRRGGHPADLPEALAPPAILKSFQLTPGCLTAYERGDMVLLGKISF
jgi:hypothetical protein